MKQLPRWLRAAGIVLVAVLWIFSATPPGSAAMDRLEQLPLLGDFQDCSLAYPMSLHVIDVGKADALCVLCGEEALLIDAGTAVKGEDVVRYLQRLGVQRLAAAFVTHPDEDHVGGLAQVLAAFPCEKIYVPAMPQALLPQTEEVLAARQAAADAGLQATVLQAGDRLTFGELAVQVLSPGRMYDSTNNASLVLRLVYGQMSFLLMGDAEAQVEQDLLESGAPLLSDVLKVGHHGSRTSTGEAFLRAVSPICSVISTGEDRNLLPRMEVLSRLDAYGPVYRTDVLGSILICSDGQTLYTFAEKSDE